MKIIFENDSTSNKISFWHLAIFLVLLPFDYFYSELVLLSFGIHTLFNCKKKDLYYCWSKPVLILISVFLLGIAGMIYSPDVSEAINVSTRQLAILLFPLLFALNRIDLEKYRTLLLKIFAYTCVATILYLYADALHTIFYFHLPLSALFSVAFMNHNFSLPIELHATYLSMYLALCIPVFLYCLQKERSTFYRLFYVLCIGILLAGLFQLSSRAVFIALLVILTTIYPFFISPAKYRVRVFLIISLFAAGSLFSIYKIDAFKTRYITELEGDLGKQTINSENTEPRIGRWKIAAQLISRSPIIGYGSGSEKKLLKNKYFEQKLYISFLNEFNCHSEYLSITLKTGITGLSVFLFLLYFNTNIALRKKDPLFLSFLAIVIIVSISENILDVNKGIFFYSFFISLFLIPHLKKISTVQSLKGNPQEGKPV